MILFLSLFRFFTPRRFAVCFSVVHLCNQRRCSHTCFRSLLLATDEPLSSAGEQSVVCRWIKSILSLLMDSEGERLQKECLHALNMTCGVRFLFCFHHVSLCGFVFVVVLQTSSEGASCWWISIPGSSSV